MLSPSSTLPAGDSDVLTWSSQYVVVQIIAQGHATASAAQQFKTTLLGQHATSPIPFPPTQDPAAEFAYSEAAAVLGNLIHKNIVSFCQSILLCEQDIVCISIAIVIHHSRQARCHAFLEVKMTACLVCRGSLRAALLSRATTISPTRGADYAQSTSLLASGARPGSGGRRSKTSATATRKRHPSGSTSRTTPTRIFQIPCRQTCDVESVFDLLTWHT